MLQPQTTQSFIAVVCPYNFKRLSLQKGQLKLPLLVCAPHGKREGGINNPTHGRNRIYIYPNGINKTNFRVNTDKENIEVG
jgi:hypothetical protein